MPWGDYGRGRLAGTSEVWDATQLREFENVLALAWECPGCTDPIRPAAWQADHKVTAHFKRLPGQFHSDRCRYNQMLPAGPRSLHWSSVGHQKLFEQALRAADEAARAPDCAEADRLLAIAGHHAAIFAALDAMIRP